MAAMVIAAVVGAVLAGPVRAWVSEPDRPDTGPVPVPAFSAAPHRSDADADRQARRPTLLPADCADALAGPVDVSALLAAPVGSYGARAVVGVGSPSVGLLEQLSCTYQRAGQRAPALVLRLAAFTDPAAAERQRVRNIAAEAGDTRAARPVAVGSAPATLLTQPAGHLLLMSYDRYTVTLDLAKGTVPDQNAEPILTDLARRVWPNLPPTAQQPPPAHPVPANPVPANPLPVDDKHYAAAHGRRIS